MLSKQDIAKQIFEAVDVAAENCRLAPDAHYVRVTAVPGKALQFHLEVKEKVGVPTRFFLISISEPIT